MEKYIGTKIIHAEKVMRIAGKVYLPGEPIPKTMDNVEHGYIVVYEDAYESWSPADVFEKAYHLCNAMPFGLAIEAAKLGFKIARQGWNGKGQYVELATRVSYSNPQGEVYNVNHKDMGNKALAFVGTSGIQLGWLASQADLLSEDWVIVEQEVTSMAKKKKKGCK